MPTPPRLSEFQAALTRLRNSLDCPDCRPPALRHQRHNHSSCSPSQATIACSSSSRRSLSSRALTTNVVADSQSPTCPKFRRTQNLSRSTLGLNSHPGRHLRATQIPTTPLGQVPQKPSFAHGRVSPSLKSAQFSFAFVPLAAGRDPSRLVPAPGRSTHPHHSTASLPQGTNPILFQSQTTPPNQHRPHLRHTHHTVTPPAPHPAKVHPTCISYRHRTTPALNLIKTRSTSCRSRR